MHIHFSGIGGTGIGPLALIAHKAGYSVSGTDKQDSEYLSYLRKHGITNILIPDGKEEINTIHTNHAIDWIVYSSALPKENQHHPILVYAQKNNIHISKRDEFLNHVLTDKKLKMIAVAGTHGKTTTTAMLVWLLKELSVPVSYSVGAKLSFGDMGDFIEGSEYFVYEADEYDRNFLSYHPYISIIPGVAYDHPDTYPTQAIYNQAYVQFISQSDKTYAWENDVKSLGVKMPNGVKILQKETSLDVAPKLLGTVNRDNAALVCQAIHDCISPNYSVEELGDIMNKFPGVSRRFEKITDNIFSDYAHTPEKIAGAIEVARETLSEGQELVVVYEGLHNTRQHFIKKELETLFADVDTLVVVPSYRAREDESLEDLTPKKLVHMMHFPETRIAAHLNDELKHIIAERATRDIVLCLTAGGGGSLDEWLREEFKN